MLTSDFHTHSSFSSDSKTTMEDMVIQGIKLGLTKLCFTEHQDFGYPTSEPGMDFQLNIAAYKKQFDLLKEQYKNEIQLLFGIELGMMESVVQQNQEIASSYPFDFIIASCHLVDSMDPYYGEYFKLHGEKEGIHHYFETIYKNIQLFTNFDVLGHLDYIVRYAPNLTVNYTPLDYFDTIDMILKKIIELGKGIEINSSALKYHLGQTHPHSLIIQRYKELGGEILTIGSDGHAPEHLAFDFPSVREELLTCGFQYYTVFENRKPTFVPL